jgi:hypothetical protein
VQSGKTASGGCSAGQVSSEPVAPRIYLFIYKWSCGTVQTPKSDMCKRLPVSTQNRLERSEFFAHPVESLVAGSSRRDASQWSPAIT